jgi:hypothetical protein
MWSPRPLLFIFSIGENLRKFPKNPRKYPKTSGKPPENSKDGGKLRKCKCIYSAHKKETFSAPWTVWSCGIRLYVRKSTSGVLTVCTVCWQKNEKIRRYQHFFTTQAHINYLCTYDLYIPVHNALDACISMGGGWALQMESFLDPVKWHRADRRVPFGAQNIMHRAV